MTRVILKRKFLEIGRAASCVKLIQDRRSFTLFISKIETILPSEPNIYIYIYRASDDFKGPSQESVILVSLIN